MAATAATLYDTKTDGDATSGATSFSVTFNSGVIPGTTYECSTKMVHDGYTSAKSIPSIVITPDDTRKTLLYCCQRIGRETAKQCTDLFGNFDCSASLEKLGVLQTSYINNACFFSLLLVKMVVLKLVAFTVFLILVIRRKKSNGC